MENMGSSYGNRTSSMLKKTLQLKVKKPDTESLKTLSQMLKKLQRLNFTRKYGNILEILEVNVQGEAITALAQFYDPPLRCFTFRDFQLAPTLEEFEKILGLSLENRKPYLYSGHYPSMHTIAEILRLPVKELQEKKQVKSNTEGFQKKYLEEHLCHLAKHGDWDAFIDVLALTIFGTIIFPNIDEFVDFAAIDVFAACKFKGENPVPAILADIYYTLNFCYENKGKRILCCLPMLFVWLTSHVFKRECQTLCPFADFQRYQLKAKSGQEWAQILAQLDERNIRWRPKWAEMETLIYQCGDFPNVPLVGTRGCISYNPSLALRQLGYCMRETPTKDMVTPFILHNMSLEYNDALKKIRSAWNKVIRKGKDLGPRSCAAKENYRQWVKDRAREVKLPFQVLTATTNDDESASAPYESEEIREVKEKLMKVEEEKKGIEEELKEVQQRYEVLKRENERKDHNLEKANKKARTEEDYMLKTKECLRAANEELSLRRQERDKAMDKSTQLEELLRNSTVSHKDSKRQIADMRQQIAKYEDRLKREKQCTEDVIAMYQEIIRREQEEVQRLTHYIGEQDETIVAYKHEIVFWMTRFSDLAELSNEVIRDIPNKLRMADAMVNPLTTPAEIYDFIEYCKERIIDMKQFVKRNT